MKGSRNPEEEVQGRTNTEKHRFSWQMKRCLSVCSVIPVALLLFIMLSGDAVAYERIVVLYASASPIIRELLLYCGQRMPWQKTLFTAG